MVFKISQDEDGADFHCQCCTTGFRLLKMDFYEESTNSLLTGEKPYASAVAAGSIMQ